MVTWLMKGKLHFQDIYAAFYQKIRRYLARLVGENDSEDVTQEVFLKVNAALGSFRGESGLSTWIYRIATNAALDHLRRTPQPTTEIPSDDAEREGEPLRFRGEMPLIDRQLVRKEMSSCIRNVIKKLPEEYRTVIVLSELEEFRNNEIAEILQVSLDTVKIRLHRARKKLKSELESLCCFYRDERNVLSCDLKSAIKQLKESN